VVTVVDVEDRDIVMKRVLDCVCVKVVVCVYSPRRVVMG
jgi:hypothetical protein